MQSLYNYSHVQQTRFMVNHCLFQLHIELYYVDRGYSCMSCVDISHIHLCARYKATAAVGFMFSMVGHQMLATNHEDVDCVNILATARMVDNEVRPVCPLAYAYIIMLY